MKIFFIVFCSYLFFSPRLFANSSQPRCSMQLLCDQLKLEEALVSSSLHEPIKSTAQLQQIFTENKLSILRLLEQKKKALPSTQIENMAKAILTVRLGSFDEPAIKKVFPGACDRPNAIYIFGMHRIFVCPSLLNYPELTLQQILAHELGHVIQKMQDYMPCFAGYSKVQRDEVFADWVASKVLAERIASEKNKKIAGRQVFQSQLLFLNLACSHTQNTKTDWANTHPNLQHRIEHIFLSQPAFQEALRCHNKKLNTCG